MKKFYTFLSITLLLSCSFHISGSETSATQDRTTRKYDEIPLWHGPLTQEAQRALNDELEKSAKKREKLQKRMDAENKKAEERARREAEKNAAESQRLQQQIRNSKNHYDEIPNFTVEDDANSSDSTTEIVQKNVELAKLLITLQKTLQKQYSKEDGEHGDNRPRDLTTDIFDDMPS